MCVFVCVWGGGGVGVGVCEALKSHSPLAIYLDRETRTVNRHTILISRRLIGS